MTSRSASKTSAIFFNEISFPVLNLEYETEAYEILGRNKKANLIKNHLKDVNKTYIQK